MIIQLSKCPEAINREFRDQIIIVDEPFQTTKDSKFSVENCELIFERRGKLYLNGTRITKCIFKGINNLHDFEINAGVLRLDTCKIDGIIIDQQFRQITIFNSLIKRCFDNSVSTLLHLSKIEIIDFEFEGVCDELKTDDIIFKSKDWKASGWDKKIIKAANCTYTIFENIRLNPYYLVTKCKDKSSLDLSSAVLIDDWSRLTKKYSGISLFIVFILIFLFFLPILTHSFFLLVLSKLNMEISELYTIPLWKALLFGGKEGAAALGYCILTLVLVFYNIGRFYITISIAKLREEEIFLKGSNFNLASIHPDKYKLQVKLDKILAVLFVLSVVYSLFKLFDALMISVPAL